MSLPRESVFSFSCLLWPCLEEERGRRELPTLVDIMCINISSKYRGPPKLTSKVAEATGYSECTVRRILTEKLEISGAVFVSLPRRCKVKEEYNTR